MSALVSHPTGNAFLLAVLRALEGDEVLSEFWTAISLPKALARSPAWPERIRRRLSQRCFTAADWSPERGLRPAMRWYGCWPEAGAFQR